MEPKEGCALDNSGGDAAAIYSKVNPDQYRGKMTMKTFWRTALSLSKMLPSDLRQLVDLPQSQLERRTEQLEEAELEEALRKWRTAFTGGGLKTLLMDDGDASDRLWCLTPQAKAKAKAKAKFKERANLMAKLADAKKKKEAKLADAKKEEEAKLVADVKKKEEPKLPIREKTFEEILLELDRLTDDRNTRLMTPNLTWEQKVVYILQMVRCRELTEYNHKLGFPAHTRLCCPFNVAFFDHDKESKGMPWKPIDEVPSPRYGWLYNSINVIAIKVAESDLDYPISVFGTVLARDEYDYRCVYLFKRGRDDPQVITSKDDTLTLMGPYRALAVRDVMFFEFHLKVKGDGDVDEDFSKGLVEHSAICNSQQPTTKRLHSCLSTVQMVYTPVPFAVEASFTVSMSNDFISKVTAWTSGNEENKIVVYSSSKEVAGVGRGGSSVVHGLVAVPQYEELVLRVCVSDEHCEHEGGKCFQLALGHGISEWIARQEPYELQVKISWRGVTNLVRNQGSRSWRAWGRPNTFSRVGGIAVLL